MSFSVLALSRAGRITVVVLRAIAALNIFYLGWSLVLDFVHGTENAPPIPVAIGLVLGSAVPIAIAIAMTRSAIATLEIGADLLVLSRRRERIEIPVASVADARVLAVPVPLPGLRIALRSGRLFSFSLFTMELAALLGALAPAVSQHPMVAFAEAIPRRRRRWVRVVALGVLPLAISVILFRLHQMIVYGGPLGQYYAMGLGPYLESFFVRWIGIAGIFFVLAGVLRAVTEAIVWGATWLAPRAGRGIRIGTELVATIVYFGALPGYFAVRLLFQ